MNNEYSRQEHMKRNVFKKLRWFCYTALALCVLWGILYFGNMIRSFMGIDEWPMSRIDWAEQGVLKISILALHSLSIIVMIALCITMLINTLRKIREDIVFPRNNEKLLFWLVLVDFVYHLSHTNLRILWDNQAVFHINYEIMLMPFLLLFFAFMYQIAADAVEENHLTI